MATQLEQPRAIHDKRRKQGTRYKLESMILLVILAITNDRT